MSLLDPLTEVLETVRTRIGSHRNQFTTNEQATRAALIDPVLRVLGWPPDDPEAVAHEYPIGQGRADYALLAKPEGSSPVCVVEAKSLGNEQDKPLAQMLNYANMEGIPFACLTNGSRWRMYDVFKPAPLSERCLLDTDLVRDPVHVSAIRLLTLWRPNLEGGPVRPEAPTDSGSRPSGGTSQTSTGPKPATTDRTEGISLRDLKLDQDLKSLRRIRFPDGSEAPLKFGYDIRIETARWLDRTRGLKPVLPLTGEGGGWLISKIPETRHGKPYPHYVQLERSGGYVRKWGGWKHSVMLARRMLKACGVSPAEIVVK